MTINPFKIFLVEQDLYEEYLLEAEAKSASINDDKGKLHELLLSRYLHPDAQLPSHFRAESEQAKEKGHAGTPYAVHDRLQSKVGEEVYNQIDSHAKETAKNLIANLKDENVLHKNSVIGDVHWTSNRDRDNAKGDHEKLTGQKDLNSNADLILTTKDKEGKILNYLGVSAKYGTNKEPNYKNPGTESLEKMAGVRQGRIAEIMKPHHHYMEKLGYNGTIDQRHAQYKVDNMSLDDMQKSHKEGQAKIQIEQQKLEFEKSKVENDQKLTAMEMTAKATMDKKKLESQQSLDGVRIGLDAAIKKEQLEVQQKDKQPKE
jgi:hypothetical protein